MGFVYLLHMGNNILKTRTFSYLVELDAYLSDTSHNILAALLRVA